MAWLCYKYERASFPSGMNSSYFFGEFSLLSTQSWEMRLFFSGTQLSSYSLSSVPGERLPKHKRSIFSLLLLLRSLFQRPESPAVKTTGNLGRKPDNVLTLTVRCWNGQNVNSFFNLLLLGSNGHTGLLAPRSRTEYMLVPRSR